MRISDWSSDVCSSDLHDDPDALCLERGQRLKCRLLDRVGNRERTADLAVDANENRGGAVAPKRVGLFSQRISRNSLVAKEAGVAEDDPTAIDGTKCAASGRGIKIPDLACREPARLCGLDDREGH